MKFNNIIIAEDDYETRIDRYLRKKYPYLGQAAIEKALRSKLIKVNLKKVAANYRLIEGDVIQLASILIQEDYQVKKTHNKVSSQEVKKIVDSIIYRDADLIVINKPAGLAVQGGSKIKTSVDEIMPQVLETFGLWDEDLQHKLVHRLDKETSGILLIALNNRTAKELAHAFKNHLVQKKYFAILKGEVGLKNGRISSIINKDESKRVVEDNAITDYRVIAKKNNHSFIEFLPVTGKNHQLRIHSLELGFPILGDDRYDPNYVKGINLHLHAAEITFPFNEQKVKIKASFPEYFLETIKNNFGNLKW